MIKHPDKLGTAFNRVKRLCTTQWFRNFVGGPLKQPLIYGTAVCALTALLLTTAVGESRARPLLAVAPPLGTVASFAVLAGSTVTNAGGGGTVITGDLGVSPGNAITGFPPGVVVGTIHADDAVAAQAQADATVAYNNLAGQACNSDLTSQDLGGLSLTPAVYCFSSSAQLTGILTLDGQGDPNAIFVFQIGSTLTTASAASLLLLNSASACNVFWQVGSSATLGSGTAFAGNLLALTSITLNSTATVSGRALAQTGAVTLDSNTIINNCTVATATPTATPANTPTATAINTPTATATNTPIATSTLLPIATGTVTATATGTRTPTAVPTGTNVPTALEPNAEPAPVQLSKSYLPLIIQ